MKCVKYFFDVDYIPDWINYNYSNKLNLKEIQKQLNDGAIVPEIANKLQIDKHRIYDAIYNKKLFYPTNYKHKNVIKKEYIL